MSATTRKLKMPPDCRPSEGALSRGCTFPRNPATKRQEKLLEDWVTDCWRGLFVAQVGDSLPVDTVGRILGMSGAATHKMLRRWEGERIPEASDRFVWQVLDAMLRRTIPGPLGFRKSKVAAWAFDRVGRGMLAPEKPAGYEFLHSVFMLDYRDWAFRKKVPI